MRLFITSLLLLVIVIGVAFSIIGDQTDRIVSEINDRGGTVVSVEGKTIFSDQPFNWVNPKVDHIYKVTYLLDSEEKTAWVIFRAFKTEWDWGK